MSNNHVEAPNTPPVHRVAITGGPCAGKTTALAEVSERLRSRGFQVYVVPEVATLMKGGGCSFADLNQEQVLNFQTQLLKTQLALEESFLNVAAMCGKESFVLTDRGACDGMAYMNQGLWTRMLKKNNWDIIELRDARYDLVVHLVTAADGAPTFYTLENNKVRLETPEEAVVLDRKTQNAWVGHPHLRVVDNRTGFREKINRVDARISELAGLELRKRIVRKFLVKTVGGGVAEVGGEEFNVEQTFLRRQDLGLESIRKRGKGGVFTYVYKVRKNDRETKRQILSREYHSLLRHCDPNRGTVCINRRCFLYDGNYFVMDTVQNVGGKSIILLRCQCDVEEEKKLEFPEWLDIDKEVTGIEEYTMYKMSEAVQPSSTLEIENLTD